MVCRSSHVSPCFTVEFQQFVLYVLYIASLFGMELPIQHVTKDLPISGFSSCDHSTGTLPIGLVEFLS